MVATRDFAGPAKKPMNSRRLMLIIRFLPRLDPIRTCARVGGCTVLAPQLGGLVVQANSHPYSEQFRSADKSPQQLYVRLKMQ